MAELACRIASSLSVRRAASGQPVALRARASAFIFASEDGTGQVQNHLPPCLVFILRSMLNEHNPNRDSTQIRTRELPIFSFLLVNYRGLSFHPSQHTCIYLGWPDSWRDSPHLSLTSAIANTRVTWNGPFPANLIRSLPLMLFSFLFFCQRYSDPWLVDQYLPGPLY